jgi:hypothetical protein
MSELRLFCIGAFVGSGLFAAAMNRGLTAAPGTVWEQMLFMAFFAGCTVVALFGRKAKS